MKQSGEEQSSESSDSDNEVTRSAGPIESNIEQESETKGSEEFESARFGAKTEQESEEDEESEEEEAKNVSEPAPRKSLPFG